MKKSIFPIFISCLLGVLALLNSCNGMLGSSELESQIAQKIAVAQTEKVTVRIQTYDNSQGTISPNGDTTVALGGSINIDFTYNPVEYNFGGWTVINKNDYSILDNTDGKIVAFADEKITNVGTLKRVSVKAVIKSNVPDVQIIPVMSDASDVTPPVLSSDFLVAFSKEKMSAGEYLSTADFYEDGWSDSDFEKNHVNKIVIKFTAGDTGSGLLKLKVKETCLTDVDGVDSYLEYFKEIDIPQVSIGSFSCNQEYKFLSLRDGLHKLEFSLMDMSGNESDVVQTIYVIKDTRVVAPEFSISSLTTSSLFDLVTAGGELSLETLLSAANIVTVEKESAYDVWYSGYESEIKKCKYEISGDDVNYSEVFPDQEGKFKLDGFKRNKPLYVKLTVWDNTGNSNSSVKVIPLSKEVVCGMLQENDKKYYALFITPYTAPASYGYLENNGTYYFYYSEKHPELHYYYDQLPVDVPEFDAKDVYHIYTFTSSWASDDVTKQVNGLVSEETVINGYDILDTSKTNEELNPSVSYDIQSNGINSGTYNIIFTLPYYEESGYSSFFVTDGNKYSASSSSDTCIIKDVPYADINKTISFTVFAVKENVCGYAAITVDPATVADFKPNTKPVLAIKTSSGYNYLQDDGKQIMLTSPGTSTTLPASSNIIRRIYYTTNLDDLSEEEIFKLDYLEPSKITSKLYVYFNLDVLPEADYKMYFYSENIYGCYSIIPVYMYMNTIRNYAQKSTVITDYYLEMLNSVARPIVSFYNSSTEKWSYLTDSATSYDPTISTWRNTFCKIQLSSKTFVDNKNIAQYGAPFYYYSSSLPTLVKEMVSNGNYVTVTSDMPFYARTLYGPLKRADVDEWERFTLSTKTLNEVMGGADGGSSHLVTTTTYTVPYFAIPDGNYYCTVIHYADGTSEMTEVKYKE